MAASPRRPAQFRSTAAACSSGHSAPAEAPASRTRTCALRPSPSPGSAPAASQGEQLFRNLAAPASLTRCEQHLPPCPPMVLQRPVRSGITGPAVSFSWQRSPIPHEGLLLDFDRDRQAEDREHALRTRTPNPCECRHYPTSTMSAPELARERDRRSTAPPRPECRRSSKSRPVVTLGF